MVALPHGRWSLSDLQRQFAYDRLLVRLYLLDDAWVVKGATALIARGISVRHTIDVDVYRESHRGRAEHDLRAALTLTAGDWFEFRAGVARPIADGAKGLRVPIQALVGGTTWARFHVDIVAEGLRMTGRPELVSALTAVAMPGLVSMRYRAYPLVDHVADKTCAILERQGPGQRPSTRFKDLIDLTALVSHGRPTARTQRSALVSESRRRGFALPRRFQVPDVALWKAGYEAEARRVPAVAARTLAEAMALVGPFLDPLFEDAAEGSWNPEFQRWTAAPLRPS